MGLAIHRYRQLPMLTLTLTRWKTALRKTKKDAFQVPTNKKGMWDGAGPSRAGGDSDSVLSQRKGKEKKGDNGDPTLKPSTNCGARKRRWTFGFVLCRRSFSSFLSSNLFARSVEKQTKNGQRKKTVWRHHHYRSNGGTHQRHYICTSTSKYKYVGRGWELGLGNRRWINDWSVGQSRFGRRMPMPSIPFPFPSLRLLNVGQSWPKGLYFPFLALLFVSGLGPACWGYWGIWRGGDVWVGAGG